MPRARLRLRHAGTGIDQTVGNDAFAADEIARLASVEDQTAAVGELTVSVWAREILGVTTKRLPAGRHRAVVEVERGGAWVPLVSGTLTNERSAHGRLYGDVRRWTLTILDDAADVVWERLEGVQLRPAAEAASHAAGRYDTEWNRTTGAGDERAVRTCWDVAGLVALAARAAGLPAIAAPVPFAGVLPSVAPAVALCAPRPDVLAGLQDAYDTVPDWTGAQLVELRCVAEGLVLEASYAAWPDRSVGTVGLRSISDPVPSPGTAAFSALVSLDDDGTGHPWYEDYDWSTEPGEADGDVVDDFALTYRGGPDGSRTGAGGQVLQLPLQATYAARRVALSGVRGAREAENAQVLELPVRLPASEAPSAQGGARQTLQLGGYAVDVSRPVFDIGDGKPDEDAVYLVSLVTVGGQHRSVVERRAPAVNGGQGVHELWARELFARLAYAVGDADVLDVEIPAEAVPAGSVQLGAAGAGVVCEGLAWVVRSVAENVDARTVTLSLARPAGATSTAEGGGGAGSDPGGQGRVESAPAITADTSQSREGGGQGDPEYLVDRVDVVATVPAESDAPSQIELEREQAGGWVPVSPTTSTARRASYQETSSQGPGQNAPNPYDGTRWRARCRYPSGTLTAWTTTTAS